MRPNLNSTREGFSLAEAAKNAALVLGSVVVCMLLLELGLRLTWHNPYAALRPEKVAEIRLNAPGLDTELDRRWMAPDMPPTRLRTDENGYILPGKQNASPVATVAFLGGSTTESSYVSEELRFPALAATLLGKKGLRVNTINAGYSGNTTQDILNIFLNQMTASPPDIVVMMEATNDNGLLRQDTNYSTRMAQPVTGRMQLGWLLRWSSSVSSLTGFVRARLTASSNAARVRTGILKAPLSNSKLLAPAVENRYRARLKAFVAAARAFGSVPVLMTQPRAPFKNALTPGWVNNRQQDRFNMVIRDVAAEENVPLVDLAQKLAVEPDYARAPVRLLYDGVHATDVGSRLYARWIADALEPLVRARSRVRQ